MSIESWLAFVTASAVLLAPTTPARLTLTCFAMVYGRRTSVPLLAAVAFCDFLALLRRIGATFAVVSARTPLSTPRLA